MKIQTDIARCVNLVIDHAGQSNKGFSVGFQNQCRYLILDKSLWRNVQETPQKRHLKNEMLIFGPTIHHDPPVHIPIKFDST